MGVVVTVDGLIEIDLSAELDFWARGASFSFGDESDRRHREPGRCWRKPRTLLWPW